jgi:hypothetical protein
MHDRRDPQALGEALLEARKSLSIESSGGTDTIFTMSQLYDNYISGMMIANYEETEEQFKRRCQEKFAPPVGSLQN